MSNATPTDDTSIEAQLSELRSTLEAAKDAQEADRDGYLKAAMGECLELRAREAPHAPELQRLVCEASVADDEEQPYVIGQAIDEVGRAEKLLDRRGRDAETVAADLDPALVEWAELEAGEDDASEWLRETAYQVLLERLHDDAPAIDVSVDVPEDFARRVELYAEAADLEPGDSLIEDFAINHLRWSHTWTVEGEPWELVSGPS